MENQETALRRTLSLSQVVALGLAWMTPMIYFSVFGIAYEASDGRITEAYTLAVAAIFFTAYSYRIMSRLYPTSGSAYTYVKKAMHPYLGFLVGWAVLLDYLFSPLIAVLTFGIYLNAQFPSVPAPVWMVLLNVILAAVNIAGVKFSAGISKGIVMIQIGFMALFCGILVKHLAGHGMAAEALPLTQVPTDWATLLAGTSLICFSFLGFDTVTTLTEESLHAKRNIPRAIMIIIAAASVLYIATSYLIQAAYPDLSFANADSAGFELMRLAGGVLLSSVFITVLILAIFTQGLTSVTSVSRLLYVMGRDRTLPHRVFGYVHPKLQTPVYNILLVSVVSMLALVIPLDLAVKFVSFGALTSFVFVNLSVIAECYVRRRLRGLKGTVRYLVFPLLGASFILWLITLLDKDALWLGACWLVFGAAYHLYRMKRGAWTMGARLSNVSGVSSVKTKTGLDM